MNSSSLIDEKKPKDQWTRNKFGIINEEATSKLVNKLWVNTTRLMFILLGIDKLYLTTKGNLRNASVVK